MTEIIAAFVTGVFGVGAAAVTVRWARSRSAGDPTSNQPAPSSSTGSGNPNPNTPPVNGNPRPDASINAGQYIQNNSGTVSQTNYRDGKR
jgi:hypothetical protein